MNRQEVKAFFSLLSDVYTKFDFFDDPENVFNMDETGFQLNNEAAPVITVKNVTIIACCSAEGRFLPSVLIFKGVRGEKEFGDGFFASAEVYMNPKS